MTAATAVRERGITFSAPMIQALLREAKWQTRRIIKAKAGVCFGRDGIVLDVHGLKPIICPYGKPGDRLYVREAWYVGKCADGYKPRELAPRVWKVDNGGLWYPADDTEPKTPISPKGRYRNARFMPRWASRITLEITEVRVQQLQEISEEDARAEGCEEAAITDSDIREAIENPMDESKALMVALGPGIITAKADFAMLWDSIHGTEHPWASNPWVFAISFRRIER